MIKTVSTQNTLTEAKMVSDFLTQNNIPCFVANKNISHLWGHFACNGFQVWVHEEDLVEAALIATEASSFSNKQFELNLKDNDNVEKKVYAEIKPVLSEFILISFFLGLIIGVLWPCFRLFFMVYFYNRFRFSFSFAVSFFFVSLVFCTLSGFIFWLVAKTIYGYKTGRFYGRLVALLLNVIVVIERIL